MDGGSVQRRWRRREEDQRQRAVQTASPEARVSEELQWTPRDATDVGLDAAGSSGRRRRGLEGKVLGSLRVEKI